jgi:hypothetical protein
MHYSVILEQITLAPRDFYTRDGEDIKKKKPIKGLATERSGLLNEEHATYTTSRLGVAVGIGSDSDIANGVPVSPNFYSEISDESGLTRETFSGDPLTGRLFGQSSRKQIFSSWFCSVRFSLSNFYLRIYHHMT